MKKGILMLLLLAATMGYSQNWNTNFEATKTAAVTQNKNILLVFSGSDWCGPCIKLDRDIWKSSEFKEFAYKNLILERADFPKKKQNQLAADVKKQNQLLADKYNKDGMFPLVVILDPKGKVLGKTAYKNTTPDEYIKMLQTFIK